MLGVYGLAVKHELIFYAKADGYLVNTIFDHSLSGKELIWEVWPTSR
jgi:hypothetical protein